MMLFPSYPQTLVLSYSAGKAISRIKRCTINKKVSELDIPLFTGYVKKDGTFRLIPHQKSANNFVPVICGEILSSSQGSIVRSDYRLNKNTTVFMIFIICVCTIAALLVFFFQHNIIKSLIIFSLAFVNYGITLFQFKREVARTIISFNKVFGDQSADKI